MAEPKTITYQGIPVRYYSIDGEPPVISASDLAALVAAGHAPNQSAAYQLAATVIAAFE